MAAPDEGQRQMREKLLADQARCVAAMTEHGRRCFEEYQQHAAKPAGNGSASASMVAGEISALITQAHRLRESAESQRDIRAALKAVDTALKAVQLYGRVTGQMTDRRANTAVHSVITREEGIQTAAEVLLDLANATELRQLLPLLQERLRELSESSPKATTCIAEPKGGPHA